MENLDPRLEKFKVTQHKRVRSNKLESNMNPERSIVRECIRSRKRTNPKDSNNEMKCMT